MLGSRRGIANDDTRENRVAIVSLASASQCPPVRVAAAYGVGCFIFLLLSLSLKGFAVRAVPNLR